MRGIRRSLRAAFLVLGCGAAVASLDAQAPPAPSQQVSVADAAVLVGREDPAYLDTLRLAINSADPAVRAVAARVAGVRRQPDMAPALRTALDAETDAVAKREQQEAIDRLQRPPAAADGDVKSTPLAIRSFPSIVPGLFSSLMRAAGCKPTNRGFGAARLTFDASGLLVRSEIDPGELSDACTSVLDTMSRLAVPEITLASERHAEYLMMPIDTEYVRCGDAAPAPRPQGASSGGKITPPRKIHDVKPVYPGGARMIQKQGTVMVSASVRRSGCVESARVTRGLDPELDFAALRAVLQWKFEPALVNGTPIDFLMFVTVNFELR